ncbi:MAG: ArgE/DapE family deacylase [Chloroflexi bacterium]|nr:ArgE/DapE family deacylase [Chloroflexota bacterium]
MHAVTQLLHDLVAIDSINPDLVPGSAGESAIAEFIAGWLRDAGLDVEIDEPSPGRPSVIGIARGSGGGRSLMLNAHIDTVGVVGMEQPHTPRIENNQLYGRGAYDMKGGLAAVMIAAAEAARHNLRGDVIVTAVADEEYASLGTESIVKRWRADAAIVTEPTQLQICLAHKGFIWLEIETRGVAAHGSKPDLGVDAIAKMGQVLVGLEALDRSLRSQSSHPLLHSGSLHASLINGGQELSSYPERCTLMVERRTIPGETQTIVEAQIQELLAEIGARDASFQASLRTTFERLPFEVAADAPIVVELARQARSILGAEPQMVGETPWMDSAILSAAGIPTVVFGPSGTGAHAVVEWTDLESVDRCAQVLLATAREFCK